MIKKLKIKFTKNLGLFCDTRADIKSLANVCNELVNKVNEIVEKINKLED